MLFEIQEKNVLKSSNDENIPRLSGKDLSYNDFFENYMLPNQVCILHNLIEKWGSAELWIKENDINFNYLRAHYGSLNVTIYNCLEKEFNSQKCCETTFNNYLDYFETFHESGKTCNRLDYLKNWHLQLNTNDNFYEVPIFFASDWLNEYCVNCLKDDYRFVYMGPKNTWTPFHADVFSSYSWSANVCGRKKWLILPPGEEEYFRDSLGNLPYDMSKENYRSRRYFEVIQEPGDAIFVPSGWHHQVWNLENTISINHNWINGLNIKIMYNSLISTLKSIMKEIEDCKSMENFEEHCQLMLNSLFGMDFYKFYDFLKYIAVSRIGMTKGAVNKVLFHGHQIGDNHIIFDLNSIHDVLSEFINNDLVYSLEYFDNVDVGPRRLLEEVDNTLCK